jgi:hypothetical protein
MPGDRIDLIVDGSPRTPRKLWHWLLLFLPAVSIIIFPLFLKAVEASRSVTISMDEAVSYFVCDLLVSITACMGWGFYWSWPASHWTDRFFLGFFAGLGLLLVNAMIAVGGCSALEGFRYW